MLILIAESKTMAAEVEVAAADYEAHKPAAEADADAIMENFAKMSAPDVAAMTKLTLSLAAKMRLYAYEFPNKRTGNKAIEAFTGVVFDALDYASLSSEGRERCQKNVGIISSLYGFLNPEDIIKNYRLDFTSSLLPPAGNEMTAYAFQKKSATINLVRRLKEENHTSILNLMPGDASKCIDWKLVKNFAKVWKVDFTDAATDKTPNAGRLKTLRGLLLRQLLEEGVSDPEALKSIVSDHYLCTGTPHYPDHLHFLS